METNFRKTNLDNIESATIVNQKNLLASVFIWMFIGMVLTTIASLSFAFIPSLFDLMINVEPDGYVKKSMLGHIITFAPLLMLIGLGAGYRKLSFSMLAAFFIGFSILFGVSLSYIFIIYQIGSIVNVFLSTCALFGVMAGVGYFTNTDLTKLGSILSIGLVGIFIASIINYFVGSSQMGYIISILAVVIFTGLTAYDMQKIKAMIQENDGSESFKKIALMGALNLYLDFINLFMALLNIFGKRN
ncbi:MAG: Membrane protein [Bacteroidetes bacterium]|jgi:FtsH-binding integral membrane protein|nr:Membrane protein [Bacteroidota bacterium]MDF2451275.1 Membrane protein [Bacteroidota bacterium]